MDESREMARKAGYDGIEFVAVNLGYNAQEIAMLKQEGYSGVTNYHEWGTDTPDKESASYENVVANAPAAWEAKNAVAAAGGLTYYPVVDTGWDSRPWHGEDALNLRGRNAALFADLLQKAKEFALAKDKKILVLGPVNEWGEGSYIEPCLEHGFSMYKAIRLTFLSGALEQWPANFAPADIGLGPYDYKKP
jgi:hypothetical protein